MTKLLISDTCDVVAKRLSDGNVFITSETSLSAISSTLGINEKIFGGIGSKPVGIVRGQKEVTANFTNSLYDKNLIAMTQGVKVENGSATVFKKEEGLKVTDNAGTGEVTISGTAVGNVAYVTNANGETDEATITTNTVTIPTGHATEGEIVSVSYQEEVTGEIVALDSDKFSEGHYIEMHTIAYDPKTNRVVKDIYIQLDNAIPSGDLELSFENGSAIAPAISFDCFNAPNSNEIGRIVEVDRV